MVFFVVVVGELCSLTSLSHKLSVTFSFRNVIKLLKTGFTCSYPGTEDANSMQKD